MGDCKKILWTKAHRIFTGKEMATDLSFELAKRMNRPEKYNRKLMKKTVEAIQKIDTIHRGRKDRFYNFCILEVYKEKSNKKNTGHKKYFKFINITFPVLTLQ